MSKWEESSLEHSSEVIGERIQAGALAAQDVLTHHGVKGMHWGIRKKEETGGDSSGSGAKPKSENDFKAAYQPKPDPTPFQGKRNLVANEKKFADKFEGTGQKVKKFASDHKSTLIKAGVYTAVIGGAVLANKHWNAKNQESIARLSGQKISNEQFAQHVNYSKMKTWYKDDYLKPEVFDRPEFTLPAGHEFHRISKQAEQGWRGATYAVHSQQDFDRYVAQFRQEKGAGASLHHVTFRAKEDVHVPDLTTTLTSLKEAMGARNPYEISEKKTMDEYQMLSGGSWKGDHASGLFDVLKRKGFGAIVDEMDAGVIGETPLVIFGHNQMGEKSSTPFTNDLITQAESNLVEITNRKT